MGIENKDSMFKQVIERRVSSSLPSNFNYHLMNKIRLEAAKQHKRSKVIGWCWLISGALFLLGFGIYMLVSYLDVGFMDYISQKESPDPDRDLIAFYWYIAVLVLILLGLDYWMRCYRRKTTDK